MQPCRSEFFRKMASCLWIYPCLLCIIFTFATTDEINDNTTCTLTNNVDCSHLLNLNNTKEYIIEDKEINRTGVKIIFEIERRIQFLRLTSGEELINRIKQINVTRGSHNHLVNLSCSKEEKIKLEPVVVSKEIQIDFVKGCGNDTDPIVIKNIHYKYEDGFFQNTSEMTPLSENPSKMEEHTTLHKKTVDFRESTVDPVREGMKPIPTSIGSKTRLMSTGKPMDATKETKTEKKDDDDVSRMPPPSEKPFKKTTKQMKSKTTGEKSEKKPIPTSHVTKTRLVATGKPVTKKTEMKKKDDGKKTNFKVGASKSSAQKISRDFACLFFVLCLFYIV